MNLELPIVHAEASSRVVRTPCIGVRSAKNRYPKALHNLGVWNSIGKNVAKDAVRSANFFLQAAGQGHALGQFKLAVM